MRFDRPDASTAAANVATGNFVALGENELENHLLYAGRAGQFDYDEVIYIRPPARERAAVSALWCRWDFDSALPKCGFYFGTWTREQRRLVEVGEGEPRQVVFLGFRYETPEEGDNHNYFHAQPCRSMGGRDAPVVQALPVPERNPTLPLAACSALELLLCLVVSLYGLSGLAELEREIQESAQIRAQRLLLQSVQRIRSLGIVGLAE